MTHGDGALRRVRSIWAPFGDLPRPSVSLLLQAGAVVGITAGASHFIGFGDVMIYMGLVALYIAMGAFGGTLRADLSVAAVYGASLLLFVALPTLVAVRSPIAGAVLVVLAVGICGIIPALGRRYGSVRLGIGLVTVYAFGYETTRNPNHAHLILGSFMALAIILVIRLMAAIPDKDGPLRASIAEVLISPSRDAVESAAEEWLRGPSYAWAAQVLTGSVQYRAALWAIEQRQDASTDQDVRLLRSHVNEVATVASTLADAVRARRPDTTALVSSLEQLDRLEDACPTLHPRDQADARLALDGLRLVARSTHPRDNSVVKGARSIRRAATVSSLKAALSLDSEYLRHAVRSMVVVALALVIVAITDQPAFALPLLMGAYGVLQPTRAASVTEARRRTAGVIVGAAVATLVVATATPFVAGIISIGALVVAFAFISSSIAIFMGALVVTLTVAIAPAVHVNPIDYAIGYALAVMVGAALAATAGFFTVPHPTPQRRRRALSRAMRATASALESAGNAPGADQQARTLNAFRAQQNTAFESPDSDTTGYSDASTALGGLNLIGLALVLGLTKRPAVDQTVNAIATRLLDDARQPLPEQSGGSPTVAGAVEQLLRIEYDRLRVAVQTQGPTG